jgi:hypothetical protein
VGQALLIIVNSPVLPEICNVTDVVSLEKEMAVPLQVPDTHVQVPSSPVDSTEVVPPAAEVPSMPPASMMPMLPPVPTIPPAPPMSMPASMPALPPVPGRVDVEDPPVLVAPPAPVVDEVPVPFKATVRPGALCLRAMLSVAVAAPTCIGEKNTQTLHESEVVQLRS